MDFAIRAAGWIYGDTVPLCVYMPWAMEAMNFVSRVLGVWSYGMAYGIWLMPYRL